MFSTDNSYNFNGCHNLIEQMKIDALKSYDKNDENPLLYLGKFIKYIAIPLHGDIYDEGKAVFENGTVNANDFKNVYSILQQ